jgi:hypothetical protein
VVAISAYLVRHDVPELVRFHALLSHHPFDFLELRPFGLELP